MAPSNGTVKARRPPVPSSKQMPKPVIPAIPLPYVKRQAAAAAAAAPVTASPSSNSADANASNSTNTKANTNTDTSASAHAHAEDSAQHGSLEVRAPEVNQSSPTLIADTPHASESLSAGSPDSKAAAKAGLHNGEFCCMILLGREGRREG